MAPNRRRWWQRGRHATGHDFEGGFCRKHSRRGLVCGCDEARDRAARIHRRGGEGNMFGGYNCVCGAPWLDTMSVKCAGDGDYD